MTRPRPVFVALVLILTFGALVAQAAPSAIMIQTTSDHQCSITFDLPELQQDEVSIDGVIYRSLTIPGGGLSGQIGHPGLPTYSGLLAVPNGRAVQAVVHSRVSENMQNLRVLPVQSESGEYAIDAGYFDKRVEGPTVILGEPAILHGQRVVPFVIQPIRYDAANQTATIDSHLEIEFTFDGVDLRNNPKFDRTDLPKSFASLLDDRVVNASAQIGQKAVDAEALGTYLVICPDDGNVVDAMKPLLDWRRRQGYNVQLATTAETGSSTSSIKSYLQTAYDTATIPLEFVVLVGDHNGDVAIPTYFESVSGYGGEGDHYYSELEGGDVLADVFLGRLSCRSSAELVAIVNKIVGYETAPPTSDPGWFTRASLTADPSASGNTTIFVSQWIKAQLEAISFTQVDTFWSGNFSSQMLASLNQGLSIFTYRGYLGMSGFTSGHASSATNGGELPFALFPTCDSGSWASVTTARNEAFLRNPNGGGIGAVALATIGTHTRYNNALFNGVGQAAINGSDHRLGVAQAAGKLEVYTQYEAFEPEKVEIWSVWSSLIGDPATDLWLSFPRTLIVDHPAALPTGASAVPITVTEGGVPVSGAIVSLFKDGEFTQSAATNESGEATFALPAHSAGSLLVTVWGHGMMPYRGALTLGTVDQFVDLIQTNVDDDASGGSAGNGDGKVSATEILQLTCEVQNRGTQLVGAVTATLSSDDPYVTILDADDSFGDLAAGATTWGAGEFLVQVAADAPTGHELALNLTATSGGSQWISTMRWIVSGAELIETQTAWSLAGDLSPGQNGTLVVTLRNDGDATAAGATGVLSTESPWINVSDADGVFGNISPSGSGDNTGDTFALEIDPQCFQGHLATFALTITVASGATQVVEFSLPVGTASSNDPVGPDAGGYYAFDNTDTSSLLAPTYDWVELDPRYGGSGADLGLTDFNYEQDDTAVIDLPFTFTYYGRGFDQIAVCSNGWIAMGNTTLELWRNWSIPGAGAPDAMIAPFWDDLEQSGENKVYTWHDAANQRFIVQWSRMANQWGGVQNFEVILNDPVVYPTSNGDGEILFQYEAVDNNDTSRGYATTGIQDLDGTGGLLYTYYNSYAPGAATLQAGRAILFKPGGAAYLATCDAVPVAITATQATDTQTNETLRIENNGEAQSVLRYRIEKVDPNPPTAAGASKSLAGSTFTADITQYPVGGTVDIVLTATCSSGDDEWIVDIEADFPPGVVVNSATDMSASGDFSYTGTLGDGAHAIWSSGRIVDNREGTATVNVTFAAVAGPVEIPFTLIGDQFGQNPHEITGIITLTPSGPAVQVLTPNGGENWAIGESRQIDFIAAGGPTTVLIELDRGDGSGWQTLATDIAVGDGFFPWKVTGPISAHSRVRVSDTDDPGLFDISDGEFTIGNDLSWLSVGAYSGVIPFGSGEDIQLDFDSTGLADGTYEASLVLSNSTGTAVTVPITLVVGGPTPVADLPLALALSKNYPNPFNPRTNIQFTLPGASSVELAVFDARGRLVKVLHQGELPAGPHTMVWDGTDSGGRSVASGMFVYRLVAGERTLHQKMLLMK